MKIVRIQPILLNCSLFSRFLFIIYGKLSVIQCYTPFSIITTTGSNPADINRFRSHTGKKLHSHAASRFIKKLSKYTV